MISVDVIMVFKPISCQGKSDRVQGHSLNSIILAVCSRCFLVKSLFFHWVTNCCDVCFVLSCFLLDNCSDLNSELQRVLTGLENVVCGRKKSSCSLSVAEVDRHIEQLTTASEHCDLAIKVMVILGCKMQHVHCLRHLITSVVITLCFQRC